jgi:hypothetical protein
MMSVAMFDEGRMIGRRFVRAANKYCARAISN